MLLLMEKKQRVRIPSICRIDSNSLHIITTSIVRSRRRSFHRQKAGWEELQPGDEKSSPAQAVASETEWNDISNNLILHPSLMGCCLPVKRHAGSSSRCFFICTSMTRSKDASHPSHLSWPESLLLTWPAVWQFRYACCAPDIVSDGTRLIAATYLGGKLQTRYRLAQMALERADHDEHERLGISAQRELEEIRQLDMVSH